MTFLFKLDGLVRATVVKRPSKTCKSPYVADIVLHGIDGINENENNGPITVMAHAPALGCNGLCDKGAVVLVSLLPPKKNGKTGVCSYRIELAETKEGVVVGINPKLAEKIVEEGIMKNKNDVKIYKREKTILNSRFDFLGMYSEQKEKGKHFVMEVKTVPLCIEPGKAFFPYGYRKKKGDTVSPRAVKHLNDLIEISQNSNADAMMCYVIQRGDANSFIPSVSDPIYKDKFYEAKGKGVILKNLYVEWRDDGSCFMRKYINFP